MYNKEKCLLKKIYFIDADVFVQSPYAMFAFEDNDVYISESTIDKLHEISKATSEKGRNASEACRTFEELRKKGNLHVGISLHSGGIIRVTNAFLDESFPPQWDKRTYEYKFLAAANSIKNTYYKEQQSAIKSKNLNYNDRKIIIVTKNISTRIKADTIRITSEDYINEQVVPFKEQYTGRQKLLVHPQTIDLFYKKGVVPFDIVPKDLNGGFEPVINSYITLVDITSEKHTAIGRFTGNAITRLEYDNVYPFGVKPRNLGQKFAQESLLAPADEAPLVILKGPAGTAKTFYSIAVGLHFVTASSNPYKRILLSRPNVKFDEDIGYLKGDEKEKIAPLLRPFTDNLEVLYGRNSKGDDNNINTQIKNLFESGLIDTQALAYLRGRSINDSWIIIDEAQNLTPAQALGILTRAGEGSKIILCGDPAQIDNPYLDERTNGLSFASERMKGSPLCRQVQFTQSECTRSNLAAEAAKLLTPKYRSSECIIELSKYNDSNE